MLVGTRVKLFTDAEHHSHFDDLHIYTTSLIRPSEITVKSVTQVRRRPEYDTCMLKHIYVK